MAFKWIKDMMAAIIVHSYDAPGTPLIIKKGQHGRQDEDPRIKWSYAQEKKGPKGIRIEIYEL